MWATFASRAATVITGILALGCDTVSPGVLLEVVFRDEPPEEVAGATTLYLGGVALAINRSCTSPDLDLLDVLCQKASVISLEHSGNLRWTFTIAGPVRLTSLVEAAPGVLVTGGVRKVGGAETVGHVEAIREGESVWSFSLGPDSAVRDVAAAGDGVWVGGRMGAHGVFECLDPETGHSKGRWLLDDPSAPPGQRVLESVVTALIPAPERGVFAAGTMMRQGGARDTWVARLITTNQPAQNDSFCGHLGSQGFHDEPGAFARLGDGLILAVRDLNPDADRVTFYRWDVNAIARGPKTVLMLDNAKYRWVRAHSDEDGGVVIAGAWRPAAHGAFEPRVMRLRADGKPDPTWKTGLEWGIRVRSEVGRATVVAGGKEGASLVGGWFTEEGRPVGFLKRIE